MILLAKNEEMEFVKKEVILQVFFMILKRSWISQERTKKILLSGFSMDGFYG